MRVAHCSIAVSSSLMTGFMSSSGIQEETQAQDVSREQTTSFLSQSSHPSVQYSQNPNYPSLSPCLYRCIATLKGSSSYVSGFAVDGDTLYIASSDGHVRLWPLDMAMDVQRAEQSSSTVAITNTCIKCVVATRNGLVSSHQDGKIRVWQTGRRSGSCHLALRAVLPTAADCLRTFLFPKNYVEVRRHRKRTWVHHVDAVTALALSPDGVHMYSVSWDRSLKVWRLPGFRCVESVSPAHDDAINAVAVSADGHVYTGSADKTIKAWRRHPGQRKLALVGTMGHHKAAVNALAFGVGGQVLYSGSCDMTVIVWESAGGGMTATSTLRGHTRAVLCLAAAGDVVCSGSSDRTVRVWRRGAAAVGYTCLAVLDGHTGAVKSLAVVGKMAGDHDSSCDECCSSRGCSAILVCSGSLDCDVKIWKVIVSCLRLGVLQLCADE
ncbi:protein JINGUBANG-like [Phragmites australis]|uniref:protein JINGUBANG-like n=1 Tax=Phragmites australis TaxID=29695 RepID=UPI002D789E51|nr:protein JINGUBANG-like [Phragmites australis]